MSNTKKTQHALASSAIAILLCFAMLIGTTFAWFTDSKSTVVNSVDSGTLKLELLGGVDGKEDLTKRALTWKTVDNRPKEDILWEPGCTYELEPVTIRNTGSLALKYTVEISGILNKDGLDKAIDWTIKVDGEPVEDIATYVGILLPGEDGYHTFTIIGHMREDAGNEYQDKHIEGVGIKVVATQYTHEYDSYNNTYDENASVPVTEITIDGIDFYVLKTEGTKMLLLTKECVAIKPFSTGNATTLWRDSELRTWLNETWLPEYTELNALAAETTIYSVNSSATNPEFIATQDRAFLLSEVDILGTYHVDMNGDAPGKPVTNPDYYTAGEKLTAPDGTWATPANNYWWTRSGNCYGDGLPLVSFWDRDDDEVHAQYSGLEIIGVRPALWIDTFATSLAENGAVSVTENKTLTEAVVMQTPTATITTSSEEGVVLTAKTGSKNGAISFVPQSDDDAFFAANDVFTVNLGDGVTIKNESKGNSGIVLGNSKQYNKNTGVAYDGYASYDDKDNVVVYRAAGKTLNINGGTFESYSGTGNGAICLTNLTGCSVNITGATFVLGNSSGSKNAAICSLDATTEGKIQSFWCSDTSVKNTTVTFTDCTFKLVDGTVIDPTDTSNSQFGNWFFGFGGTSGNTLTINGQTVIG